MEEDQESYLKKTGFKEIIIRGLKKVITEITSIKSLALGGVFALLFVGKLDSWAGVVGIMTLAGLKEIPISDILGIIKEVIKLKMRNGGQ